MEEIPAFNSGYEAEKDIPITHKDYSLEGTPVIKVGFSPNFSRPLYYPCNYFSAHMAYLMRRKAFTKTEISYLRDMGFKVEIGIKEMNIPEKYLV